MIMIPRITWRDLKHDVYMGYRMLMLPTIAKSACKDCSACCFNFTLPGGRFLDPKSKRYEIPNKQAREGKEFFWLLPRVKIKNTDANMCPLFTSDGCLIYEDRPQTCRTFFCNGTLNQAAQTYMDLKSKSNA